MYYNRVDLLVYACLESQNVNRELQIQALLISGTLYTIRNAQMSASFLWHNTVYLLMSKNHNMPQADKDAVYKYSEPIAPGYFLNKATYNGCNIDDL